MDHGGGSNNGYGQNPECKISMLWNWYTVDSCFIARSWHVTSRGMFAGCCIGVILLVMLLELVRRGQREYDAYIARSNLENKSHSASFMVLLNREASKRTSEDEVHVVQKNAGITRPRATLVQQIVRAGLYMVQFGMAYLVMLLAMYYNGYFIICILVGAFLGNYCFGYDTLYIIGNQERDTSCC